MSDLPDTIDLAFDKTTFLDDGRNEPLPVVTRRGGKVAETIRLDPTRIEFDPYVKPPKRRELGGPIGSFLLHLLPLLALVTWLRPPLEIPIPIPIQLVVEQPPPPPPPPQAPEAATAKPAPKPPLGLRASEDMGEVGPPKPEKGFDAEPPTQGAPAPPAPTPEAKPADASPEPPPAPTQVAAALPPPPPAPPKPAPPKKEAAVRLPKPDGLTLPLPIYADRPSTGPHSGKIPGPNATRDEYLAYLVTLTLRHINLLPLSFVGARHGDTILAIVLRSDGSITSVSITRGSSYEDIDEKIVQMIRAVGRFPPPPSWMPGPQAELIFHMHFPHPAQR